jgi:hypothetical protein
MEWIFYAGAILAIVLTGVFIVQRRRASRRKTTTDDIYPMW